MSAVSELVLPPTVVSAAAAGDTAAFTRIVARHHDDMVRVCRAVGIHEFVDIKTVWLSPA